MSFNWGGLQSERAAFLRSYQSVGMSAFRLICAVVAIACLLVLILSPFGFVPTTLVGLALIFLGPLSAIWSFHLYSIYLQSNPSYLLTNKARAAAPLNSFDYSSVRALQRLNSTRSYSKFWTELNGVDGVESLLFRLGLDAQRLGELLKSVGGEGEAERLANSTLEHPVQVRCFNAFDLIKVAFNQPVIVDYLSKTNQKPDSVVALVNYYALRESVSHSKQFWQRERQKNGGFAKLWATSYTNLLDRFTQEVTADINQRTELFPLYGRSEVVERTLTELSKRTGQNVLLIGEAGIGKEELFYALAGRITSYQTKSDLDGRQVRILDLQALLAAAPSVEQQGPLFQAVFADISRAGNIVLFIPQIDLLFSSDGAGSANVSTLLTDYLSDERIHVIGTISPERHVTLVRSAPLLAEKFSAIEVPAPAGLDLENILFANAPLIESRYHVFFVLVAFETVVSLAARFIKDQASPQREINLLEEAASAVHAKGQVVVSASDVQAVVSQKANVPLQVDDAEQVTLLHMEEALHSRVVGQQRAIKLVSDALLRARAGLSKGEKPIGSFLFLGPTGVGKTETAKAIAEQYFGSSAKLIRLDMTEYADANGLSKLLGSDPNKEPGALTVAIQQSPSAVVLFDEVEKASDIVKNVLLQVLDEGRLTTNFGKVLDFTNTIIVATSNAGSDFIKTQVEKKATAASLEKQLIDHLIADRVYLPDFLNRFDGVVVYLPLSLSEIKQVVTLQLAALTKLVKQEKGIELIIADSVVVELARRGYDPVFGARALQRVIKNDLETVIARQIIAEKPVPGSKLTVSTL